jgi:hypothetical protein
MTDDGMPIIDVLCGQAVRLRRRRGWQLMAIEYGSCTSRSGIRGACACAVVTGWGIRETSRTDLGVGDGGNAVYGYASVYDDVVVHNGCVVNDCGLAKHVVHLSRRQHVMRQVVLCEVMDTNEGEVIGMQTEIKTCRNMETVVVPTGVDIENCTGWQRSPAAGVTASAPGHPRGTPDAVRAPNPA